MRNQDVKAYVERVMVTAFDHFSVKLPHYLVEVTKSTEYAGRSIRNFYPEDIYTTEGTCVTTALPTYTLLLSAAKSVTFDTIEHEVAHILCWEMQNTADNGQGHGSQYMEIYWEVSILMSLFRMSKENGVEFFES
jgi:hypothetical protein